MDYKEHMLRAVNYIEENLQNDIELKNAASAAGYTVYHFLRVFKEVTGLSPGDYIRKRRLTEIARKIMEKKESISNISYYYGFNSQENFIRAFKREHQILPSEYKLMKNSLKLYDKYEFQVEPFGVKTEICFIEGFSLTVYKSEEGSPPPFWNQYNCRKWSRKLSGGKVCLDYGVSIWNGKLDYFIGILTENALGNTEGTLGLQIPSGLYAVFETPPATHYDFVNTIHKTWNYINTVWLKESGYLRCAAPEFETYLENSRSFSEKIYIPIRKRDKGDEKT